MRIDSSSPHKKIMGGKTLAGLAVDPAIAGLERNGISRETALTMLKRGQKAQVEAIGRGAARAVFEIVNDSSEDKSVRKTAADTLMRIMGREMPPEDLAMCLLLVGYPREREIVALDSHKVDTVLKNVLLDEKEDQELRSRSALLLKERKFAGFNRPEDQACYLFFTHRDSEISACGLAAVPFLLGRLREDLSIANRQRAAHLLGEISDLFPGPHDWREVVKMLRIIAENQNERIVSKELRDSAAHAFKRITGIYPSQDKNPSTTYAPDDD